LERRDFAGRTRQQSPACGKHPTRQTRIVAACLCQSFRPTESAVSISDIKSEGFRRYGLRLVEASIRHIVEIRGRVKIVYVAEGVGSAKIKERLPPDLAELLIDEPRSV